MKLNKKVLICAMIDANMNNKELSQASGVSIARISNARNNNNITYETGCKIAKALSVPIQELIDFEE